MPSESSRSFAALAASASPAENSCQMNAPVPTTAAMAAMGSNMAESDAPVSKATLRSPRIPSVTPMIPIDNCGNREPPKRNALEDNVRNPSCKAIELWRSLVSSLPPAAAAGTSDLRPLFACATNCCSAAAACAVSAVTIIFTGSLI